MDCDLAIVIPAYKKTYLQKTLESIANQTDKRFHLYIGDDCSPYDLKSIVEEFSDRIPLTYHRFKENLGGKDLVAHWERCIALTTPWTANVSNLFSLSPSMLETIHWFI